MLSDKITENFFNSDEGMRKVNDVKILDMLIGGSKIIGIEQGTVIEFDNSEVPLISIYFENAAQEKLALQINPLIENDGKINVSLFVCREDARERSDDKIT